MIYIMPKQIEKSGKKIGNLTVYYCIISLITYKNKHLKKFRLKNLYIFRKTVLKFRKFDNYFKQFHLSRIIDDVTIHDGTSLTMLFRIIFQFFRRLLWKKTNQRRFHYHLVLLGRRTTFQIGNRICVHQ